MSVRRFGFLTIGLFDPQDPAAGHEQTLGIIELAEQLGFDSVWLRDRHFQHGISSPVAMLAAASQRTNRIEMGTAVIPLGWENPVRLAEDLATVDLLSGGRVNPGISVGPPMRFDDVKSSLYPDTSDVEDFSKRRVERFMAALRGDELSAFEGRVGIEDYSRRVQPHSPGLIDRLWYGGMRDSAQWAALNGLNYLTSSVVDIRGTESRDFATIQAEHIDVYRETWRRAHPHRPVGRVSQGLVVIPTDSATAEQVERYEAYAASRFERTTSPQGPRGMVFSPDFVGTSEQLAQRLGEHAGFQRVDEVAFALPFTFAHEDYLQIIHDMAQHLGPALGWKPGH
ncbi:LLM class flavin-dependent oxidoreductase [Cumulibacter soli]|uniref:LLM class flavin-dependent oxidoreductase n=1 Tax=Cumulibacter soli TaxID=2546344 RepID=UPI001068C432|nr:LLM class flavin-dependent oxidoreductase [Cumulibacter soli]